MTKRNLGDEGRPPVRKKRKAFPKKLGKPVEIVLLSQSCSQESKENAKESELTKEMKLRIEGNRLKALEKKKKWQIKRKRCCVQLLTQENPEKQCRKKRVVEIEIKPQAGPNFCSQEEYDHVLTDVLRPSVFACIHPSQFPLLRNVCKCWRKCIDEGTDGLDTFKFAYAKLEDIPDEIKQGWRGGEIPSHEILRDPIRGEQLIHSLVCEASLLVEMQDFMRESGLSIREKSEVMAYLWLWAKSKKSTNPEEKSATQQLIKHLFIWWFDYGIRLKTTGFAETLEQQKIKLCAAEMSRTQTMIVKAYAGCGKTSTIMISADFAHLQHNKRFVYFAFNRAIKDEAEDSGKFAKAATFCSMAYQNLWRNRAGLYKNYKRLWDEMNKKNKKNGGDAGINCFTRDLSKDMIMTLLDLKYKVTRVEKDDEGKKKYITRDLSFQAAGVLKKILVKFLRSTDERVMKEHTWYVKHFVAKVVKEDRRPSFDWVEHAQNLWEICQRPKDLFQYENSSLTWAGAFKLLQLQDDVDILRLYRLKANMTICIDEAQDLNPAEYDVFSRQKCALMFVGDPHQRIYVWRGAHGVFASMSTRPPDFTYTLTRTFRMGFHVCSIANYILRILAPKEASEGSKLLGKTDRDYLHDFESFEKTHVNLPLTVIGRSNKGLVSSANDALKSGFKVDIKLSARDLKRTFKERLFKDLFYIWLESETNEPYWETPLCYFNIQTNHKIMDKELQGLLVNWNAVKEAHEMMDGRADIGLMIALIDKYALESPKVFKSLRINFTREPTKEQLNEGRQSGIFHELNYKTLDCLAPGDERGPVVCCEGSPFPIGSHMTMVLEEHGVSFRPIKKMSGQDLIDHIRPRLNRGATFIVKFAQVFYSTTHKCKGCEYENVLVLNDFRWCQDQEKLAQKFPREEMNLLYVAVTRCKKNLYLNEDLQAVANSIFPRRLTVLPQPIEGEPCFQCKATDVPLHFKCGEQKFCPECAVDYDYMASLCENKHEPG